MSKHTSGPWTVGDEVRNKQVHVYAPQWRVTGYVPVRATSVEEDMANARVMAAAPDLLEACKKASTCASIPDYVMDVIRTAIEKAERDSFL